MEQKGVPLLEMQRFELANAKLISDMKDYRDKNTHRDKI
jgi:hypothetical protein